MAASYDRLQNDVVKAYLRSAATCMENEEYEGAEEHLKAALEQAPDHAEANLEYGYLLLRLGRPGDAEPVLRKAMALAPEQYRPCYHLAYVYVKTPGREDEGLALYRRAMELAADDYDIRAEYANVLVNLERLDDAARAYQDLLAAAGEKPYPYCALGYVEGCKEGGDLGRARDYYARGIALYEKEETDPCEYLWALYNLAELDVRAGDPGAAFAHAGTLVEHDPFTYLDVVEVDETFAALRADGKRFDEMMKGPRAAYRDWLKENATVMPGDKAPDFKLKNVEGRDVKLSDFKGQLVVLNIWATWCGPCRREIPDLSSFYEAYKDRLVVLGVCTEEEMTPDDLKAAAADLGATYPQLVGSAKMDQDYIAKSGSIPETYIIGADGRVVDFILGSTNRDALERKVTKYL